MLSIMSTLVSTFSCRLRVKCRNGTKSNRVHKGILFYSPQDLLLHVSSVETFIVSVLIFLPRERLNEKIPENVEFKKFRQKLGGLN